MKVNYLMGDVKERRVLGASPNEMFAKVVSIDSDIISIHASDTEHMDFVLEIVVSLNDLRDLLLQTEKLAKKQ